MTTANGEAAMPDDKLVLVLVALAVGVGFIAISAAML
jgi:hypothetical protein